MGQHYRIIHKKEATGIMKVAFQTMLQLYGEETLAYICFLSERKSVVSIWIFNEMNIFAFYVCMSMVY